MKKARVIFLNAFVMLLCMNLFSQKIDVKKGIVSFDGVQILKVDGGTQNIGTPCPIVNLKTGKPVFIFIPGEYYPDGTRWVYYEVRFADFDLSYYAKGNYKDVLLTLFKNGMITENGEIINKEEAEKFVRLYGWNPPQQILLKTR